jgi:hypothetical protein
MAKMSVPILVDWESIKDHLAKSDIVEVIRCKDCKHYSKEDEICLDMFGGSCNEDGYCAWAERKDHD